MTDISDRKPFAMTRFANPDTGILPAQGQFRLKHLCLGKTGRYTMCNHANKSTKSALFLLAAISPLFLTPTMANAFQQDPPVTIDASEAVAPTFLNTSPLYANSGSSYPACMITNISTVSVDIQVDLIDNTGSVLYTSGLSPYTVPAGVVREFSYTTYTGFSRCRFTVYANPAKIRANLSIFHLAGSYFETLAADDAR